MSDTPPFSLGKVSQKKPGGLLPEELTRLDDRLSDVHSLVSDFLSNTVRFGRLTERMRPLLDSYTTHPGSNVNEHGRKLLFDGWDATWLLEKRVYYGLFGNIRTDKEAATLHGVFEAAIRCTVDSDSAYEQRENAELLEKALAKYLSLRGRLVDERLEQVSRRLTQIPTALLRKLWPFLNKGKVTWQRADLEGVWLALGRPVDSPQTIHSGLRNLQKQLGKHVDEHGISIDNLCGWKKSDPTVELNG